MNTVMKIYIDDFAVPMIGDEVPTHRSLKEVPSGKPIVSRLGEETPGFQEVEVKLMDTFMEKYPDLKEDLRKLLGAAYDCGHLFGTWKCLNEKNVRESRHEKRYGHLHPRHP